MSPSTGGTASRLVWTSDPTRYYVYVAQEEGFEDTHILGVRRTLDQAKALCLEETRCAGGEDPLFLTWEDHDEGTYPHMVASGGHESYRYSILRYDLTESVALDTTSTEGLSDAQG